MKAHVNSFRKYLEENNLPSDEAQKGAQYLFRIVDQIKNGPTTSIVFEFIEGANYAKAYLFNYLKLTNTSKQLNLLQLINDLNQEYSYCKFQLDKSNDIIINACVPVENFSPQSLMMVGMQMSIASKDEYSRFVRILNN